MFEENRPVTAKFGGSSVADASQIRKTIAIVRSDPRRRFIVVSAPGKRNDDDKKITDLLYLCHDLHQQNLDFEEPFAIIRARYCNIAKELGVTGTALWIEEIAAKIAAGCSKDWIASRGEYLSGRIIAAAIDADFVDPAEGILFGPDGRLQSAETYGRLGKRLSKVAKDRIAVIPGFYGADAAGNIVCFSRGGSDVTGAIVARSVNSERYENWTDVSGMLMADPRIVNNPKPIEIITYREQRELSYMGASILHDEAVFPVREGGIPIHILNTNAPGDPGTRIVSSRDSHDTTIVGVAGRRGFVSFFTEKAMMNQELGYGRRVLEILETHGISYEHSPTSIDTLSVIIPGEDIANREDEIADEIRRTVQPDRLEIQKEMSMVAVVGQGMVHRVGVAAKVFAALAQNGVNIRMINQGSSELNIIVGIDDRDFNKAIIAIYNAFA